MQVVIIDPRQKYFSELNGIVHDLVDNVETVHFRGAQEFFEFFKRAKENLENPEKKDKADGDETVEETQKEEDLPELQWNQLRLIISDAEATAAMSLDLWQKILRFISDKANEEDAVVRLLLTAHPEVDEEESEEALTKLVHPAIFNVVYKPFDRALVRQEILLALQPDGRLSTEELFSFESEARIEMIKDIDIEFLTELGFRTRNRREIEVGKRARYYGGPLQGDGGNSVFAYCYANRAITASDGKTRLFNCSFGYFGVPSEQLSAIRRGIAASADKQAMKFDAPETSASQIQSFVYISKDRDTAKEFGDVLKEKFSSTEFFALPTLQDLRQLLSLSSESDDSGTVDPSWSFENEIEMKLSLDGESIFEISEKQDGATKPVSSFLGKETASFRKAGEFNHFLAEEDMKVWQDLVTKGLTGKETGIVFSENENNCYFRLSSLEKVSDEQRGEEVFVCGLAPMVDDEITVFLARRYGSPQNLVGVIVDHSQASPGLPPAIRKSIDLSEQGDSQQVKIFQISNEPITDYVKLKQVESYDDAFTAPFDVFYLSRKLKMHFPELIFRNEDDSSRNGIPVQGGIKTALPVKIRSVSEVHVSVIYHRPVEPGRHRRFVLWRSKSNDFLELLAVCRFVEEVEENAYCCEFLFFGLKEVELRNIRQWIREECVEARQKD